MNDPISKVSLEDIHPRADLSNSRISDFDLSGADLFSIDFSDSLIVNLDLSGADLTNVDFSGAEILDTNLSGADLTESDLSGAQFNNVDLTDARLIGSDLSGTRFNRSDLRRVSFHGSDLEYCEFNTSKIQGAKFTEVDVDQAKFVNIDDKGVDRIRNIIHKDRSIRKKISILFVSGLLLIPYLWITVLDGIAGSNIDRLLVASSIILLSLYGALGTLFIRLRSNARVGMEVMADE